MFIRYHWSKSGIFMEWNSARHNFDYESSPGRAQSFQLWRVISVDLMIGNYGESKNKLNEKLHTKSNDTTISNDEKCRTNIP